MASSNFLSGGEAQPSFAGMAKPNNPLGAGGDEAAQAWEDMNRMLKEDPEEYKRFIQDQMDGAKKEMEEVERNRPTPSICIESWGKIHAELGLDVGLLVQDRRRVFISICGSDKVPPLSSTKDGSVPIVLREPVEVPADQADAWKVREADRCIAWQAVFHPGVIKKSDRDATFRRDLVSLALECVKDKGAKLLRLNTDARELLEGEQAERFHRLAGREGPEKPQPMVMPPGMFDEAGGGPGGNAAGAGRKKKGKKKKSHQPKIAEVILPTPGAVKHWPKGSTITVTGLKSAAQHNGKRGEVRSFDEGKGRYVVWLADGEAIRLKPDNALLEELPCTSTNSTALSGGIFGRSSGGGGGGGGGGLAAGDEDLIVDLAIPGGAAPPQTSVGSDASKPKVALIQEVARVPKFELVREKKTLPGDASSTKLCHVLVSLPGKKNGKGCDLEVSGTVLLLKVPDFEELEVKLPVVVDASTVSAKFEKAHSRLRVTLRVICEHAGWQEEAAAEAAAAEVAAAEAEAARAGRQVSQARAPAVSTAKESLHFMESLQALNGGLH
jgi:hypothetical protein